MDPQHCSILANIGGLQTLEAACLNVDSDPVLGVCEAATAAHHAPHLQQHPAIHIL